MRRSIFRTSKVILHWSNTLLIRTPDANVRRRGERKLNTELVGIQGFFTKLRLQPEHPGDR